MTLLVCLPYWSYRICILPDLILPSMYDVTFRRWSFLPFLPFFSPLFPYVIIPFPFIPSN